MKAVLVIDMPEDYMGSVIDVRLYGSEQIVHEKYINKLKPMPTYDWHEEGKENECEEWYRNGWNACLDEIEGQGSCGGEHEIERL